MRHWIAGAVAILALTLGAGGADASGGRCNLDPVVGYQLVFAKPIVARIQNGKRETGYEGCEVDRVLVFADNTGIRCKDVLVKHTDEPPTGYLLGRSMGDLKLCVEGDLLTVIPTN
jgi:hypothetical protein